MKRFITCLLIAVLLVASFATAAMAATAGDEVTVEIKAENNPGFAAYFINLGFDADALELKKVEKGALSGGNLDFNEKRNTIAYTGDESTGDGVLFTITFQVKEGTKPGKYPVTGTLTEAYNEALDEVTFTVVGADVVVVCDHAWGEWTVTKEAGCVVDGEQVRVCSACGEKEYAVIPALGHTPAVDAAVAATCTETGLTEGKHCSVCNEVLVAQEVVPALGHDYKAVVTEPTCTKAGYTTYTCANCGDSYVADEVAALGHKYVWKFVDEENHQQICSVCGHKGQIAPHNFGDDTICDDCGYDKGKDPVPPTGDITPVIVTTAFAVVAAIAAAAYMLKRKFNV